MKKKCIVCNKVSERPVHVSYKRWEIRKYCSPECYSNCGVRKKRLSKKFSGKGNPMYGLKGEKSPTYMDKSSNWKGDSVSYGALHKWIKRNKPNNGICEHCGERKRLDLANISKEYKRDVNDYRYLCTRCHRKFDLTPEIRERLLKTGYKKGHPKSYDWTGKHHKEESKRKIGIANKKQWAIRKITNN